MNRYSAPLFLLSALTFFGCSSAPSGSHTANQGSAVATSDGGCAPAPEPACSGKVCGADCTPTGSDEPFNCNAAGQCVSAGHDLQCAPQAGGCPEFLGDCIAGEVPTDHDGDGCIDGCGPAH